jgi:hypothetical protein
MAPRPQPPLKITSEEPRVTNQVAGRPISFLVDMRVTYSVLTDFSDKLYLSQISMVGVDGLF